MSSLSLILLSTIPARAAMVGPITWKGGTSPLLAASNSFTCCASHLAGAAAIFDEAKPYDEPRSPFSAAANFISNAGLACKLAAEALDSGRWEGRHGAAEELGEAAREINSAGAALLSSMDIVHFVGAATALEAGAGCTGCINMASAAGPDLQACGEALECAGVVLLQMGNDMAEDGGGRIPREVGNKLLLAGEALISAGQEMHQAGCCLESGWQVKD